MKKKYIIISIIAVILVGYTGMKHVKKWNKQKQYTKINKQLDDVNIRITPMEINGFYNVINVENNSVYYLKENDIGSNMESVNVFDLESQTETVLYEFDAGQSVEDCAIYNGKLLYVYHDYNDIDHLVYDQQEIYQGTEREYIDLYGDQKIYVFIENKDVENQYYSTIYQFDGILEEVWNNQSDTPNEDEYAGIVWYVQNGKNQLMFYTDHLFYWEENGVLNNIKLQGNVTEGYDYKTVIGDYLIYKSVNKDSGEYTEQIRIYNMNTGKDIPVDVIAYENKYGKNINDFNYTYCMNIGNNMFVTSDIQLRKGVIDEEDGLILYSSLYDFDDDYSNVSYSNPMLFKDAGYLKFSYLTYKDGIDEVLYYLMKVEAVPNEKQEKIEIDIEPYK